MMDKEKREDTRKAEIAVQTERFRAVVKRYIDMCVGDELRHRQTAKERECRL